MVDLLYRPVKVRIVESHLRYGDDSDYNSDYNYDYVPLQLRKLLLFARIPYACF